MALGLLGGACIGGNLWGMGRDAWEGCLNLPGNVVGRECLLGIVNAMGDYGVWQQRGKGVFAGYCKWGDWRRTAIPGSPSPRKLGNVPAN